MSVQAQRADAVRQLPAGVLPTSRCVPARATRTVVGRRRRVVPVSAVLDGPTTPRPVVLTSELGGAA